MKKDNCVYCHELKPVQVWKETGEEVCYDCRVSFLDQEFETSEQRERKEEQNKKIRKAFDAIFGF